MILGSEVKIAQRANTGEFYIIVFVRTVGRLIGWQVWQACEQGIQFLLTL